MVDYHRDIRGGCRARDLPALGCRKKEFCTALFTVHIYYIYTHSQSTYSILLYGFMKRERDNKDLISWEGSARRRVFCEADADARE